MADPGARTGVASLASYRYLLPIGLACLGAGTPSLVIGSVISQCSGTLLLFSRFVLSRRNWLMHTQADNGLALDLSPR